jgi:hypothetical protein
VQNRYTFPAYVLKSARCHARSEALTYSFAQGIFQAFRHPMEHLLDREAKNTPSILLASRRQQDQRNTADVFQAK